MLGLNQFRVVAHFTKALLIIRVRYKDSLEPFSFFRRREISIKEIATYADKTLTEMMYKMTRDIERRFKGRMIGVNFFRAELKGTHRVHSTFLELKVLKSEIIFADE